MWKFTLKCWSKKLSQNRIGETDSIHYLDGNTTTVFKKYWYHLDGEIVVVFFSQIDEYGKDWQDRWSVEERQLGPNHQGRQEGQNGR